MRFQPKTCEWCETTFQPHSGRQARCDTCRALPPDTVTLCRNCTGLVSGRRRWGRTWGGECDRAERRVHAYLERTRAS
jgi:hypothetical protein